MLRYLVYYYFSYILYSIYPPYYFSSILHISPRIYCPRILSRIRDVNILPQESSSYIRDVCVHITPQLPPILTVYILLPPNPPPVTETFVYYPRIIPKYPRLSYFIHETSPVSGTFTGGPGPIDGRGWDPEAQPPAHNGPFGRLAQSYGPDTSTLRPDLGPGQTGYKPDTNWSSMSCILIRWFL